MSRPRDLLQRLTIPEHTRSMAFRVFLAIFSGLWILQILDPLWVTWRNEPSWGIRIGVTALTTPFVLTYAYAIFRLYFYRRSWSSIYTTRESWILRSTVTGLATALVFWRGDDWAFSLIFAVLVFIITAPPLRAFTAAFQSLIGVAVILLLASVATGTMLIVLAFSFVLGMVSAAQLRHGGEIAGLVEARYTEVRMAATEERLRIARDLHDVLGHTLSLITLKSELASRLIEADPAQAQQEMREVERIARSAMAEVRRTVAGERQLALTSEIDAARQLLAAANISVRVDDDEGPLPNEIASLFAWSVREGVTNVVRHSRARRCTILFRTDDDVAQLTILDDGPDTGTPGSGTGHPNLRQRAEDMGGSVSFEVIPGAGHRLCLRVPIPGSEGME